MTSIYTNPTHLAHAPQLLREALTDPASDIARLLEVRGFAKFNDATTREGIIESFYAYILSCDFACLKIPFLLAMIQAAAPAAQQQLGESLMHATVTAIVCTIDIWTQASDDISPVQGYVPPTVLPLEQIAAEFARSFGPHITDDMFDEALSDNNQYYYEHTLEGNAIEEIRAGRSNYETWSACMCIMQPFLSMDDANLRRFYADLKARISDEATYRDTVRRSLQRRVSLRKCSARIRQLAELIASASSASAASTARPCRPATTPARAQTAAGSRNHRAAWNKPVTA